MTLANVLGLFLYFIGTMLALCCFDPMPVVVGSLIGQVSTLLLAYRR